MENSDDNFNSPRDMWRPRPVLTSWTTLQSIKGTKCCLPFIQYIKAKLGKWGITVCICSDSTNGYICSFNVYTSTDLAKPLHTHGLAHGVVINLLERYLGKGYTVYTDISLEKEYILVELYELIRKIFLNY